MKARKRRRKAIAKTRKPPRRNISVKLILDKNETLMKTALILIMKVLPQLLQGDLK
jgi:hypothetical protein